MKSGIHQPPHWSHSTPSSGYTATMAEKSQLWQDSNLGPSDKRSKSTHHYAAAASRSDHFTYLRTSSCAESWVWFCCFVQGSAGKIGGRYWWSDQQWWPAELWSRKSIKLWINYSMTAQIRLWLHVGVISCVFSTTVPVYRLCRDPTLINITA